MKNNIKVQKQADAYEILFNIENMIRVSMHNIMIEKVGISYFSEKTFPPFLYKSISKDKIDIIKKANSRKQAEKKYNLSLGYEYQHFWYLDFKILIAVLDNFWNIYFNDIINESNNIKEELINRLKLIIPARNALAHNRYISNIERNDIENSFEIINIHINKKYLFNFQNLAINIYEKIVEEILIIFEQIIEKIKSLKTIEYNILYNLKSSYSVYISINKIDEINEINSIIELLINYNKLPRKPGSGDIIRKFISNNKLDNKISNFVNSIRRKI